MTAAECEGAMEQSPQMDQPPIVNIAGDLVALGPLRRDLVPLMQRWHNDVFVRRTFGILEPSTLEQYARFYDEIIAMNDTEHFLVYERRGEAGAELRPIGYTYLTAIDDRHRTAEFGIMLGEADARGKGYGTEATLLTLDFGFVGMGLHNIALRYYAYNRAGRRAYEKAGFREFARRRESKMMGGKFWDQIYMQCLATDFVSPILSRILVPDEER
jgi:RimJ/RimL family protein N-acetyltransferase